jgi:hypothetical protein
MDAWLALRSKNIENVGISVECDHFDSRSMYGDHEAGPRGRAYSLTYLSVISDSTHPRPIRITGRWNYVPVHRTKTFKAEKYGIT